MSKHTMGSVDGGVGVTVDEQALGGAVAFVSGDVIEEFWTSGVPGTTAPQLVTKTAGFGCGPKTAGFGCGPKTAGFGCGTKTAGFGCKKSQGCITKGGTCKVVTQGFGCKKSQGCID